MRHFQIGTRASIDKNDKERNIRNIYIFFFDKDGNALELNHSWEDFPNDIFLNIGNDNNPEFIPCIKESVDATQSSIVLSNNYFANGDVIKTARIHVLANIEDFDPSLYYTSIPILQKYNYTEQVVLFPEDLDKVGIPMYGFPIDANGEEMTVNLNPGQNETTNLNVTLRSLMARVDFTVKVNSNNIDESGTYPRYRIDELKFGNMPKAICLGTNHVANSAEDITTLTKDVTSQIQQAGASFTQTFYMLENLQEQKVLSSTEYSYIDTDTDKKNNERYKALRAKDYASYLELIGVYFDPSYAQTNAQLKFYLGQNNYNDFKVKRNCHYDNYVTITGLLSGDDKHEYSHVLYDSRVHTTVTESTPYYLSVMREHDIDAHFGVTPIDFYLYGELSKQRILVEIEDASQKPWIRMEKIPGKNMEEGSLPYGMDESSHIKTNKKFAAGNGKRKYFLDYLVQDVGTNAGVLKNNTSLIIDGDRDRIYVYIDENISKTPRSAILKITHQTTNDGGTTWNQTSNTEVRKIDINQRGLWEVKYDEEYEEWSWSDFGYITKTRPHYFYIEQIEEYLDNYDPYDNYDSQLVYEKIVWGFEGEDFGGNQKWSNVYHNGHEATNNIMNVLINSKDYEPLDLNTKPGSAAEYCYNRNKRNASGSVVNNIYSGTDATSKGWFLPGITQLEELMTQYQSTFTSFRTEYYWSSGAGKKSSGLSYAVDPNRARATKYNESTGTYIQSDQKEENQYEQGGGSAKRGVLCRVRAAYYNGDKQLEN